MTALLPPVDIRGMLRRNTITYCDDKNGKVKSVSYSNNGRVDNTSDAMGRTIQEKILMEGSKYVINEYAYPWYYNTKSTNSVKLMGRGFGVILFYSFSNHY